VRSGLASTDSYDSDARLAVLRLLFRLRADSEHANHPVGKMSAMMETSQLFCPLWTCLQRPPGTLAILPTTYHPYPFTT
jgi:hypothetical protein